MKMDIRNILFWIFLIISMMLLIWNVFGNSPAEFVTLATLIFTVLLKIWTISDRQIKFETRFNSFTRDFKRLADDFKKHIKHK